MLCGFAAPRGLNGPLDGERGLNWRRMWRVVHGRLIPELSWSVLRGGLPLMAGAPPTSPSIPPRAFPQALGVTGQGQHTPRLYCWVLSVGAKVGPGGTNPGLEGPLGGKPPPPCGDMWVCQVVIALREIAQATALHRQKEIKADHEPECPVLRAFRRRLQGTVAG